jgi:hypothetical protein
MHHKSHRQTAQNIKPPMICGSAIMMVAVVQLTSGMTGCSNNNIWPDLLTAAL